LPTVSSTLVNCAQLGVAKVEQAQRADRTRATPEEFLTAGAVFELFAACCSGELPTGSSSSLMFAPVGIRCRLLRCGKVSVTGLITRYISLHLNGIMERARSM